MREIKTKRVKAYAFRQFQRTIEKERIQTEKTKSIGYGRITEQIITYKKRPYSIIVYRDSKGRFTKSPYKKIEKETGKFKEVLIESEYSRASVFAEIPYHDKYYWFGVIVIDKKENIDIEKMKDDLLELLENMGKAPDNYTVNYKKSEWWFDVTYSIEYPKPFSANRSDKFYEKWSKTKI